MSCDELGYDRCCLSTGDRSHLLPLPMSSTSNSGHRSFLNTSTTVFWPTDQASEAVKSRMTLPFESGANSFDLVGRMGHLCSGVREKVSGSFLCALNKNSHKRFNHGSVGPSFQSYGMRLLVSRHLPFAILGRSEANAQISNLLRTP